ncbi:Relaxase/Mobilisation nuclease domain-containing protein [Niastella yeongjuensis]|nr:Relaxase/Mobilisation nuclease domain-containing protein [Niastella yeongjuensis]
MDDVLLGLRMLAVESRIMLYFLQTGRLEDEDMARLYRTGIQTLAGTKIFVDDEPGLNLLKLRAKARQLKRRFDIGLILVDYLQLMSDVDNRGNREQEISRISRGLKLLAKELGIPVIALSQLSRDLEKRTLSFSKSKFLKAYAYDGKAVNLSNNYRRMANFCRQMEKKYNLREVLNPRKFLSKEQRLIPRQDMRKERLKNDIRDTLQHVTKYQEFEQKMKSLGYSVLKGRGISFIDDKKVNIKGSEVGFSLSTIERILELRQKIE